MRTTYGKFPHRYIYSFEFLCVDFVCSMLKDELLGLAADPHADLVFRNQHTNMDVLYRTGETQRVRFLFLFRGNEG